MTHIAFIQQQMSNAKATICELLGWTAEQYADMQYRTGCTYLQSYISRSPEAIDELIESPIFWKWWRNEWHFRDTRFLHHEAHGPLFYLIVKYKEMHDADMLLNDTYPCGQILNNSYSNMISDINKSKTL